jgi:uncharacterized protein YegL
MARVPDDLATNRQERCPVVLALDVSSSMADENRIGLLNEALIQFKQELVEDVLASLRVELAIITFGDSAVLLQDFVIAKDFQPPTLQASGMTAMGQAADLALKTIEARKAAYRSSDTRYYRPWIWLMSDGGPNDAGWEQAGSRLKAAEDAKKVRVFAVGIGETANLGALEFFSTAAPLRVKPGLFREMFAWLSTSLKMQSNSAALAEPGGEQLVATTAAGEQIKLPPPGWATL